MSAQPARLHERPPVHAEPERRMTPTERVYALAMATVTRAPAPPEASVELTRNAKGDRQWTITVRGTSAAACCALAKSLDADLAATFPHSADAAAPAAAADSVASAIGAAGTAKGTP